MHVASSCACSSSRANASSTASRSIPSSAAGCGATPGDEREARFGEETATVPVYDRGELGAGDELEGPAIVELAEATCVVRPGWRGRIDDTGTLVLSR